MVLSGGVTIESPPYRWFDKCSGQLTGSLPHTIDKILKNLNIEYQYTPVSKYHPAVLSQFNNKVLTGEIDARTTNDISRMEGIHYSQSPISNIILSAYFRGDRFESLNLNTLKSLKGAVITPSMRKTNFSPAQRYLKANDIAFSLVPSEEEGVKKLLSNEYDYILSRKYSYLLLKKENLKHYDMVEPITSFYFSVGAKSRFANRMEEIDQQIKQAYESGLMDFLDKEYLLQWFSEREKTCEKNSNITTKAIKLRNY